MNSPRAHIRKLDTGDLKELLTLYTYLHTEAPPDPVLAAATWKSICKNPSIHYFGAFDEKLVSTCNLSITQNLTRGCRPFAVIENVVTHPDHRRNGYGRAVLTAAMEEAKANRCYKVMLLSGRKEEAVIQFYQSLGFDRDAKQGFVIMLY